METNNNHEAELPIPADNWTVTESNGDGSFHLLHHQGKLVMKSQSPAELRRFRQVADHCNKMGLTNTPKIQCAADAPNPEAYLKKISANKLF